MITHLMPMVDFVLEHYGLTKNSELGIISAMYAKFLKQPINLGMFVPCDENGNVLEDPKESNYENGMCMHESFEYELAKERVLFEGWEMNNNKCEIVANYQSYYMDFKDDELFVLFTELLGEDSQLTTSLENVNDLANLGVIKLTESAQKQIFG